jgi:hypothetical protein
MFDAVIYINLEFRVDRQKSVIQEIAKVSHITKNVHRVDAILNTLCGHIGCGKSHIKALEFAIENNWDSVLIVEDDLKLVGELSVLDKIENTPWDVMLLGYAHNHNKQSKIPFLLRAKRCTTTIAYIVRKHYYHTLLENFKESVIIMQSEFDRHSKEYQEKNMIVPKLNYCTAIDQHWHSLQAKDTFYALEPKIAIPKEELYSDNNCSVEHQTRILHQSAQS